MIRIPVSDATHIHLTRASRWLCSLAYVGVAAVFVLSALSGHRQAQAILGDAVTVMAPVQLDRIEESRHKGRVSHEYQFRYDFTANGQRHRGQFATSEANATPYLGDQPQVEVAYARADPSRFERLERLRSQKDLGPVLGRLTVGLLLLLVLAGVLHLLLTRRLFVRRAAA